MSEQDYKQDHEALLARSVAEKKRDFQNSGRLKHLIYSNQLNVETLQRLIKLAIQIEKIASDFDASKDLANSLRQKRVVLYFSQPSTRTFASFVAACQILGISTIDFRDAETSSAAKGEHVLDTLKMFSTYNNAIIMRTHLPSLAEVAAYVMNETASQTGREPVNIINAGSGADEHPTQALLDIFTIDRAFSFYAPGFSRGGKSYSQLRETAPNLKPGISGKNYCFIGDLGRGRTVHSIVNLLSLYPDVRFTFVSPSHPKLMMPSHLKEQLARKGTDFREETDLHKVLPDADVLYVTRRQDEHGYLSDDRSSNNYLVDELAVSKMPEHAIVMHPLPRNDELSRSVDKSPKAMYFEQANNGMWIRSALLCYLFDVEMSVNSVFERHGFTEYQTTVEV